MSDRESEVKNLSLDSREFIAEFVDRSGWEQAGERLAMLLQSAMKLGAKEVVDTVLEKRVRAIPRPDGLGE